MKRKLKAGSTSQSVPIFVQDSSSTTGAGLGSLVYNTSGLVAKYRRQGQSSETTITLATMTLGTWASGGFVTDGGGVTGDYELGLPDAVIASAAGVTWVIVKLYGATNMLACQIEIELDAIDYQDAVHFGMSAIPNVASGSAGAIPTTGTGANQISVTSGKVITPDDQKVDLNTIKTNPVANGGTFTFPTNATGASTANITAGTITTVTTATNVTTVNGLSAGVITAASIAADAITAAKIADGAIDAATFAAGAIDAAAIATDAIGSAELAASAGTEIAAAVRTELTTELARLDAAMTTRMGTYTQPTNFLATTFPTTTVASSAEVTAIQNNTRTVIVVSDVIERPDSGTDTYLVHLYLYDEVGNMEAPDSAPTVALVNSAGTDRSSRLGSTTGTLVGTGHYKWTYTNTSTDTLEQLLWEFSVVEGGATRLFGRSSLLVDTTAVDFTASDRTILQATATAALLAVVNTAVTSTIPASLTTLQADTDDIQTRLPAALTAGGNMKADSLKLNGATPNNLAAGAQMDLIDAPNATAITAINSGMTTTAHLDALFAALSIPTAAAISTQVLSDLAEAHGPGSWQTATGFSTHSAADVWTSGTRTLTSGAAPSAAVIADAVWDEVLSGHLVVGSASVILVAAGGSGDPMSVDVASGYTGTQAGALIYRTRLLPLNPTFILAPDRAVSTLANLEAYRGEVFRPDPLQVLDINNDPVPLTGRALSLVFQTKGNVFLFELTTAGNTLVITTVDGDDSYLTLVGPKLGADIVGELRFNLRDITGGYTVKDEVLGTGVMTIHNYRDHVV